MVKGLKKATFIQLNNGKKIDAKEYIKFPQ